jgi:hypothetical protein
MKNITLILFMVFASIASAQLTGEARILKEKRDAKIAEIDKIYHAELEKLKLKALQNKDKDAAIAIGKELGEDSGTFAQGVSIEDPLKHIIGRWTKTASKTKYDGDLVEFIDERNGRYRGIENFKVRYNPTTQKITIDSGTWKNTLMLTSDPDKLHAVTDSGSVAYQLVRAK